MGDLRVLSIGHLDDEDEENMRSTISVEEKALNWREKKVGRGEDLRMDLFPLRCRRHSRLHGFGFLSILRE